MKLARVAKSHELEEELLEDEISLINQAICSRRNHLRSVDELDRRDVAPKQRKQCPTNKRKFRDKREADRVRHLITTGIDRYESGSYKTRFNLKRSYKCSCGYWHHTSQADRFKVVPNNAA